jgi:enterochelin esterase-like enzyme
MLDANITGGPLFIFAIVTAAVLTLLLAVGVFGRTKNHRWWYRVAGCALGGILLGLALSWLVSDVWDSFGVPLSPVTRGWVAAAFAGLALAVNALWRTPWWTRAVAVLSIPMILLASALGINADVGEFPTLGAVLTPAAVPSLQLPSRDARTSAPSPVALWRSWHPPTGMPKSGRLGSVTIPGTVSKFPARKAIVYLPPAALVSAAPALPVMIVLSGQPGQPMNDFQSGHLLQALEAFQKSHRGLSPIVVSPDQLGSPLANPMCVDSRLGNSATYLTIDVPAWIRSHLRVLGERAAWSIGGFSQGGTCSIQLGAAHPDLFGSILDVSGELVPRNGSPQHTVQVGFDGNPAAYEAAKPLNVLAAHAPYPNTTAIFAVGATDSRYGPWERQMAQAAQAAGMTVHQIIAPGTGHDWHTAGYALAAGLKILCSKFGLSR